MPLPFEMAIEEHWREHRPRMVAELDKQGKLREAVSRAADRTVAAESAAFRQGVPAHEVMEMFREQWAFLPSEDDVPELPTPRSPL